MQKIMATITLHTFNMVTHRIPDWKQPISVWFFSCTSTLFQFMTKKAVLRLRGHICLRKTCAVKHPQSWRVTNTCRFPFEWLLLNVNWQRVKGKISKLLKIDTLRRKTLKVNVHCLIIVCKPPLTYCLLLLLKNEWSM